MGVLRIDVQHFLAIVIRFVPIAVLQKQESALQKRSCIGIAVSNDSLLYDRSFWRVRFCQFLDSTDQILHKAELGHILRLKVRKLLRQIVGIHISVSRDQHLLGSVFDQRQIPAPFILDPYSVKVFGFCTENDHDLGAVECSKYVRLVGGAQLVLQRDAGEKHLEALLGQLVIQVIGQHAVLRPSAAGIRLLVADKHIEGLFLLRNSQNTLLDFIDGFGLGLIDIPLGGIGIVQGRLVVIIIKDRGKLRPVHRRHAFVGGRILHIFNTVTAEHKRPICFGVGLVLVQDLLIDAHGLIVFIVASEVVSTVIEI